MPAPDGALSLSRSHVWRAAHAARFPRGEPLMSSPSKPSRRARSSRLHLAVSLSMWVLSVAIAYSYCATIMYGSVFYDNAMVYMVVYSFSYGVACIVGYSRYTTRTMRIAWCGLLLCGVLLNAVLFGDFCDSWAAYTNVNSKYYDPESSFDPALSVTVLGVLFLWGIQYMIAVGLLLSWFSLEVRARRATGQKLIIETGE